MMTTNLYKLNYGLNEYYAYRINDISNCGICGEISDFGINYIFDGTFEAKFYQNGKFSDIKINGWTFACNIEGSYHVPGTYYSTSYEFECYDPYENELRIYNTPYNFKFSEKGVLCNYLELAHIYSYFENADIAIKFNYLSRSIDEGMYGARGRTPMKITYGEMLDLIKFFRDYYENLGEDADAFFKERIKETVNGALDFLKKRLNFDKIE